MSLKPSVIEPIPLETVRVAKELAKIWNISHQQAQHKIYENFISLLEASDAKN